MEDFPPYPMFLNLIQCPVLVVGGGSVGLRKTRGLIECAARVTVVSPSFAPGFEKLTDIERIVGPYAATHMARKIWRLVFATTDSKEVNALVQKHAEAQSILCCRADEPDEGDFSSGATQRVGATRKVDGRGVKAAANTGGLVIAVSTAGASPVLAGRICREAAAGIDPILPVFADLLSDWRAQLKEEIGDIHTRRRLLLRLASEEMEGILRKHGAAEARRIFADWLGVAKMLTPAAGEAPPSPAAQVAGSEAAAKSSRVVKNGH